MTFRIKAGLLSVFMLLVMALCLCGCGEDPAAVQSETEAEAPPEIFIEESQQLPRESTPPALMIETVSGGAASATTATLGGYVWEWMDESGKVRTSEDEAPCAADMKNIVTIDRAATDGKAKLQITGGSLRSVQIWADGVPMEEGEKIAVTDNCIVFPESGSYRYEIVVDYTGGRVYYAFKLAE